MELALGGAAFLSFFAGFPASALLLRCGLSASQRFSPRAALALSSLAALCACASALLARGGLRAASPASRLSMTAGSFMGGTLGRALLLMTASHLSGSYELLRIQAIPLLLLCVLSLVPAQRLPARHLADHYAALPYWAFLCGMTDGFFGAGGMTLLSPFMLGTIVRRRDRPTALMLLLCACAQGGALALTLAAGAAQVFPGRMLFAVGAGAAMGIWAAEADKKRGAASIGLRIALKAYLIIAALSGLEQAFLS